jgi:hypothetical protein
VDDYIKRFGVVDKNSGLPKSVWVNGSENYRKGLIDGLFSSDGNISKTQKRITYTSSHKQLIDDLSELLGFYGIKCKIKTNKQKLDGYDNEFTRYDLRICETASIKHFINLFKLTNEYKQNILDSYQFRYNIHDDKQIKVESVELTDIYEDVWDISVFDTTHCFQISKLITGNCCEIALRPYQFCNLCEVNVSNIESQEDYNERVKAAAFIGTLQAGYTDFHYLREIWRRTTEKEALIGVGMTGIGSGVVLEYDMVEAANIVKEENARVAALIGINAAARSTTVKPSGCQIPSTEIRTNRGTLSLDDIFKLNGVDLGTKLNEYREWYDVTEDIKVYNHLNEEKSITKLFVNGYEETIEFVMEDGTVIECTPNHKFMMVDGTWKEAKEITENDDFLINIL